MTVRSLNNLVTSILVFEGNGRITEYIGGYDDWVKQKSKDEKKNPSKLGKNRGKKPKPKTEGPRKLTFREKQELENIPALIESLEQEHTLLFSRMSDPSFYKKESTEIAAGKKHLESLEVEIKKSYERWEVLEAINENCC